MKNNKKKILKHEDSYCPICGVFVEFDFSKHHCLDEDIKKIEEEYKEKENTKELEDRTYDDKLSEFDEFYNSDNYYDNDTEEE